MLEVSLSTSYTVLKDMENNVADTPAERKAKRAWEAREREKDPEGFKRRQVEAQKRYYEKNADKVRERRRKYYEENRELESQRRKADYAKNAEKRRAASQKWRAENREKFLEGTRKQNLKKYGLTPEAWTELFTSQGNRCDCCGTEDPKHKNGWFVDHCHQSGGTRSIICHACNSALGHVNDNITHLQALIAYLERHNGEH
jgi:hypothetical protein